MKEDYILSIQGAGGSPPDEPKARIPKEAREGISGQYIKSGELNIPIERAVSLSQIRTLDLLSEGEIDGLVSGEYSFIGVPGELGYRSAVFKPYSPKVIAGQAISYLRSIYWNDTPVVDKDNLFNFQQIDVAYTPGKPNGSSVVGIGDELTISRNLQERLRGPNSILDAKNKQQIIGEVEQFAKYYRILNKDCKGAIVNIRVNALSQTVVGGTKAGDTTASSISYRIYYKPIFNKAGTLAAENVGPEDQIGFIHGKDEEIKGKISYGYIRSSRINFEESYSQDPTFIGWAIKIFRLTPDSLQGTLRNQTYIDSLTEIYGNAFCYPNSAIVSQSFNAEYFSQIPSRAFDVRLLKVRIPNNYDPIRKTYDGVWDGTWKEDEFGNDGRYWTDNPAWCFYDLISNSRYGLGKYIDESLIDKWTLYEISRYCDTMVPDGFGGVEPRFTCNMIITSREEAYKVLNDMASIFRAIIYYQGGSIYTSMDVEKEAVHQFTNANVVDGNFNYASSSKRVRHSVAIVRYNDKTNLYQPAIEYVEDTEAIKRYGYKELEVAAFGCTSRGQAIRYGRWALISEALETETVSFDAGLEGAVIKPGDIFKVSDFYKNNSRQGGRVINAYRSGARDSVILLDDYVTGFRNESSYKISITSPTFSYNPTKVDGLTSDDIPLINRNQTQVVFFSGGDVSLVSGTSRIHSRYDNWGNQLDFENRSVGQHSVWMIESTGTSSSLDSIFNNKWDYYRAIRIEEKDENLYSINALQYELSKYQAIDSGLNFESQILQVDTVSAPESVSLTNSTLANSSLKSIRYSVFKNNMVGVNGFLVYAKLGDWVAEDFSERFTNGSLPQVVPQTPDSKYLINILPNVNSNGDYIPLSNGVYYFRAYARNLYGVPSEFSASASISVFDLDSFQGLRISSLRVEGQSDNFLGQKAADVISSISPTFRWQASLEDNPASPYTIGDVYYRMTVRKSTSPNSSAPATVDESPIFGDPYQPSTVIYHQENGYKPDDISNPSLTFDLIENISSFTSYFTNQSQGVSPSGVIRDYDVVIEAHLQDGTSSAGGNIFSSTRGAATDSLFLPAKSNGWDILHVSNPKVPALELTQLGELDSCQISALSNPSKVCTEQWIDKDGTVNLNIVTNNLYSDVAGGFIYSCREEFNKEEALNGKKANGTPVFRGEFTELSNPILATSNLQNYRSGWIAASFYDELDKSFREEMIKVNPAYNSVFISGLNVSNSVVATSRGLSESLGQFASWGQVELTFRRAVSPDFSAGNNGEHFKIEDLSWFGPAVKDVNLIYNGSVNITLNINFDTSLLSLSSNISIITNYTKSRVNLPNSYPLTELTSPNFETSEMILKALSNDNAQFIIPLDDIFPEGFQNTLSRRVRSKFFIGFMQDPVAKSISSVSNTFGP